MNTLSKVLMLRRRAFGTQTGRHARCSIRQTYEDLASKGEIKSDPVQI